jgi:LDH2 family malate/lactate/ureidoglycolate dehydrogenase
MTTANYSIDVLKETISNIFRSYGLSDSASQISADVMVTSEAAGLSSHGILTLPGHLGRLSNNQYNLNPFFDIIRTTPSFITIDGDNAIGYQSASRCMELAIDRAKETGLFTVFSKNNNTFGPGFYYVRQAASQGLIAIVTSNSPAAMAPWEGKDRLLGTNPFAMGIPIPDDSPILFDMASSKVAKSKIKPYYDRNEPIPDGWALDQRGKPTNDPLEAINGLMLPMADHKGSGIAMMIDILSGVLSGAAFLNQVNRFYTNSSGSMNVGYCMIAMDPGIILGKEYEESILNYKSTIVSSRPITDGATVHMPGDHKNKHLKASKEKGIFIEKTLLSKINAILKADEKPFEF